MKIEIEVSDRVGVLVQRARGRVGEPYASALLGGILTRWAERVLSGGLGRVGLGSRMFAGVIEWLGESVVETHISKLKTIEKNPLSGKKVR